MTEIEQKGVFDVYSNIAQHFSNKRRNQWSWITEFINNINETNGNISVLDVGCGNGRNMEGFNSNIRVFGLDMCDEFVNICKGNGKNVLKGDMTDIPFSDNFFTYILSIASFHHLSTEERRLETLNEIYRVSTPDAILLISVWSLRQPQNTPQSNKITHYGGNLVKWNKNGVEYDRYYYIFSLDEILDLFSKTGWKVTRHFWDYGNEIFILKK